MNTITESQTRNAATLAVIDRALQHIPKRDREDFWGVAWVWMSKYGHEPRAEERLCTYLQHERYGEQKNSAGIPAKIIGHFHRDRKGGADLGAPVSAAMVEFEYQLGRSENPAEIAEATEISECAGELETRILRGESQEEIATAMGVDQSTVSRRLRQLRPKYEKFQI